MVRKAKVDRSTSETQIEIIVNLDGAGNSEINTPIPFLSHMLHQVSRHGYFDLRVQAKGDIEIDGHHTVEDIGIALGLAFKEALGDKKGIKRFSDVRVPLNEALAECVLDISGRAFFVFNVKFPKAKIGDFDVELVSEFFQAFSANSGMTIHIGCIYQNLHHAIEAIFKAFARALDAAVSLDSRSNKIPSTKGSL